MPPLTLSLARALNIPQGASPPAVAQAFLGQGLGQPPGAIAGPAADWLAGVAIALGTVMDSDADPRLVRDLNLKLRTTVNGRMRDLSPALAVEVMKVIAPHQHRVADKIVAQVRENIGLICAGALHAWDQANLIDPENPENPDKMEDEVDLTYADHPAAITYLDEEDYEPQLTLYCRTACERVDRFNNDYTFEETLNFHYDAERAMRQAGDAIIILEVPVSEAKKYAFDLEYRMPAHVARHRYYRTALIPEESSASTADA